MHKNIPSLFSQMNIVQILLDKNGIFLALNPAAETLFGKSANELIGLPFTNVLDPFSHEKALLMIAATLSEGEVAGWELDHLQADEAPILLEYTTHVLKNDSGDVIGLGAFGSNISNKLQLTAQLAQANQELEGALLKLEKAHTELKHTQAQLVQSEKMRALGQLVAGIAHEINNPTAFVANNLAQLDRLVPQIHELFKAYLPLLAFANAEQRAAVTEAESAVEIDYLWNDLADLARESIDGIERIRNIVLSLRNFSRLEEAQNKYADINEGLRSTLRLVRPMCKNRIQIFEQYADLPQIPCFPGELNQVFLNLLTNAVQAIHQDGMIQVKTSLDPNKIIISIQDSGSGMELSTLKRLGEPFFTTKPVGMGIGLGLSTSYGIIEHHHGLLRYDSELGKGTTVFVELPIA